MRISIDTLELDLENTRAIPLEDALICAELKCSTIFTSNAGICPRCGGSASFSLKKILNREEVQEAA